VKGLLDFAREAPPLRQPTDLNAVVRHALSVLLNQLSLDHVAVSLALAEDLPKVPADANQLEQVVLNLVLNAADAVRGREGGSIRIATCRTELEPSGHAVIRAATCPKGCDLLDPVQRIGGLRAIRILRRHGGSESVVHLDPVYGRANHLASEGCDEGVVSTHACPRCHRSLETEGVTCGACGSSTFAVEVAGQGAVHWCARKGCRWSHWAGAEAAGNAAVAELVVEDNGRGIRGADLPHLFEPFFSTKGTRGTGLGLAVTWGIVDGHGGTIDVQSEPGAGARFCVRLPLEPLARQQAADVAA
jgi:signal transduction histidine kinase